MGFVDGGTVLSEEWQCFLAVAEAVANRVLGEQDLLLPFASPNAGENVRRAKQAYTAPWAHVK